MWYSNAIQLETQLSNKWHKKSKNQKAPSDHEKPTYHGNINWPSVYPVKIEPSAQDDQRNTDQNNYWGRQLRIAIVLNVITGFAAIVGLYGLTYLRDQNKLTQETLKTSQGAYVTIGKKDGTVAEFIVPERRKDNAVLILYFQNSGHIPAKLAWGLGPMAFIATSKKVEGPQSSGITFTHPFSGMTRMINIKSGSISEKGDSTLIAGDSIFKAKVGEIPQGRLAELFPQNAGIVLGEFQYCDELGKEAHRSFSISYENAPTSDLNFRLTSDHPAPNLRATPPAGWEYLTTCQTAAEYEKQEEDAARPVSDCTVLRPWPCRRAN
jgi:hypothetical protein